MSEFTIDLSLPGGDCVDKRGSRRGRQIRRYTAEKRQRAIELYDAGTRKAEISRLLGVPDATLRGWLKRPTIPEAKTTRLPADETSDGDNALSFDSASEGYGSIGDRTIVPDPMDPNEDMNHADKPSEEFFLEDLTMGLRTPSSGEASMTSVVAASGDSNMEKRKRNSGASLEAGSKRQKIEAPEALSSIAWEQSSLQALSSMIPSSTYQQQQQQQQPAAAAAHPGIVKPKAKQAAKANYQQQPAPMTTAAQPGYTGLAQNTTQMSGMGSEYNQQIVAYYIQMLSQQHLLNQQQQQQVQQQILSYQQMLSQQQQQQLQQQLLSQEMQQQQQLLSQEMQQQLINQMPQQQLQLYNQQQQEQQPPQQRQKPKQKRQSYQQKEQQQLLQQQQQQLLQQAYLQSHSNFFNQQPLQMTGSTMFSADGAQDAQSLLSAALTTPKSSGRGKRRSTSAKTEPTVAQQYINVYQEQLNKLVTQNMMNSQNAQQQQQINMSPSLQITLVGSSETQNPSASSTALYSQAPASTSQYPATSKQSTASSLQNPAPAHCKSRSDNASPKPRGRSPTVSPFSPLPRGHSPLSRVQSPLSRVQSPLTDGHAPLPSSTPNPYWPQPEEQLQPDHRQSQLNGQHTDYKLNQVNGQHPEHRPSQQNVQQQRPHEELERVLDSAYHSQDSQSSTVTPFHERPSSPDQREFVDGNREHVADGLAQTEVLQVPPSIMNPLKVRGKGRGWKKKRPQKAVVCDNVAPEAQPVEDMPNCPSLTDNDVQRFRDDFIAGLKAICKSEIEEALSCQDIARSLIPCDVGSENKENAMHAKPVLGKKRGKRKGKNNGKRAIKKKHSRRVVAVKKECVKLEPVDIESVKVELEAIKQKRTIPPNLQVEGQTIVLDDNEKKRKRTLSQDTEVLQRKFRPNQMVLLDVNWLSLLNQDP